MALATQLIGSSAPETLELVQGTIGRDGILIETQTICAILAEIETRVPVEDSLVLWPGEATSLADPLTVSPSVEIVKARLQGLKHFAAVPWAPSHYTSLLASRPSTQEEWDLEFKDSLEGGHEASYETAQTLARRLGLLAASDPLPQPTNVRYQADGWTCGLWSSRSVEESRRKARGEARGRVQALSEVKARANEIVQKVRAQKATTPAKSKTPAKPKKPAKEGLQPQTLEEALVNAMACTKCRVRGSATKGCQWCCGKFWDHLREKKARR